MTVIDFFFAQEKPNSFIFLKTAFLKKCPKSGQGLALLQDSNTQIVASMSTQRIGGRSARGGLQHYTDIAAGFRTGGHPATDNLRAGRPQDPRVHERGAPREGHSALGLPKASPVCSQWDRLAQKPSTIGSLRRWIVEGSSPSLPSMILIKTFMSIHV